MTGQNLLALKDFRRFFVGQTSSVFGDALAPLAIAFAVIELTHSATALGLVLLSSRLPMVVFALVGGAVGDRYSRRTVMLVTDSVRCLAQAATAVLLITGTAELWMIIVLQLVTGAGSAFFNPAAQGLITSLVPQESLIRANSLISISRSSAQIAAFATSATLVATVGSGWAVLIDAATFAVSGASLYLLPRTLIGERLSGRGGGLFTDIGAGLAAVRERSWLWVSILHVSIANIIVISPLMVIGPLIADEELGGPAAWGALAICYSIGGLLGGVVSHRWHPHRMLAASMIVFLAIVPFSLLMAWPGPLVLIGASAVAAGAQLTIFLTFQSTVIQQNVPPDLISRVSSVNMLGGLLGAPIGMALAGPIADATSAGTVFGVGAVVAVLVTALALLVPSVWQIGVQAEAEPDAEVEPATVTPADQVAGDLEPDPSVRR